MSRVPLGVDVFEAAIERLASLYRRGDRVILSFSAGKDSGACLELMILAAQQAGWSEPVEVVMRDDEIMLPGTFEYAERVAARPEVRFHWLVARQPVINIFSRDQPYFWAFDPDVPPDDWVRLFPDWATHIDDKNIRHMVNLDRFPPLTPGGRVVSVTGVRGDESHVRLMGVHSSGGFLTKPTETGIPLARPIYDWKTGDVWKAHKDMGWDFNAAYTTMHRLGVPPNENRIGPPTQSMAAVPYLGLAAQAWPAWFARVARRLPGVRAVAQFGKRAIVPDRRTGESWEDLYNRVCLDNSPEWIIERAQAVKDRMLANHARHSPAPFPDSEACYLCTNNIGSWKKLVLAMVTGDPFSFKQKLLREMEPEFFRAGAGTWHPSKYGHRVAID